MDVVAVVGLGYVGLPLAVAFGKLMPTIGYDLSLPKLDSYRRGVDPSGTVSDADLRASGQLEFTSDATVLSGANVLIVAVPTPIDAARHPDFRPLVGASESIGAHLKPGDLIYTGTPEFGLTGKDIILTTLGQLGRNTVAMERSVEYRGEATRHFSTDMRFTIANMTAEFGGLNGIFEADAIAQAWIQNRPDRQAAELAQFYQADADAPYVARYSIDLGKLGPLLAKPKTVSLADLAPTPDQGEAADWVAKYLTRLHYASKPLDDVMSREILKRYLEALDGEKVFFLKADIDSFEHKYATSFDEAIEQRHLDAVYDIYKLYLKRLRERTEFAQSLLPKGFDFNVDEDYAYDRKDAPWAASKADLDEHWRQRVKNDWLRLKLAKREDAKIGRAHV